MDDDTKHFLESLVSGLENNLRREMRETEARILQRTDELVSEAKVDLLSSMNQWKRTRDLRIFAVESRVGELEKRVDAMDNGKQ
jgi:hypothetical protein